MLAIQFANSQLSAQFGNIAHPFATFVFNIRVCDLAVQLQFRFLTFMPEISKSNLPNRF